MTCPTVLPMSVAEFLFERVREELDEASCQYEVDASGRVLCLCDDPGEDARAAVARWELVRCCELQPGGQLVLRMLADQYAHHPDHRLEWHNLH